MTTREEALEDLNNNECFCYSPTRTLDGEDIWMDIVLSVSSVETIRAALSPPPSVSNVTDPARTPPPSVSNVTDPARTPPPSVSNVTDSARTPPPDEVVEALEKLSRWADYGTTSCQEAEKDSTVKLLRNHIQGRREIE